MSEALRVGTGLSICVINYQGASRLKETIGALQAGAGVGDEIIVVDSASSDGSVDFVRRNFPAVKVVMLARNLGPAVARNRGYEACRDDVLNGDLGWTYWGTETFEIWKKEVALTSRASRPFTEGSRGKIFRVAGIVGERLHLGWERVDSNPWGIDQIKVLTVLSDQYQNVAMRTFLPWPVETFPGVTGKRIEHLRLYGVFVKNDTYDTKFARPGQPSRSLPVTVPLFVILHAEPFPEDAAAESMQQVMVWVAISMLIFGLFFYFVLIRGGSKQAKAMDEHRLAIRMRARAKGQAPIAPSPESAAATETEEPSATEDPDEGADPRPEPGAP